MIWSYKRHRPIGDPESKSLMELQINYCGSVCPHLLRSPILKFIFPGRTWQRVIALYWSVADEQRKETKGPFPMPPWPIWQIFSSVQTSLLQWFLLWVWLWLSTARIRCYCSSIDMQTLWRRSAHILQLQNRAGQQKEFMIRTDWSFCFNHPTGRKLAISRHLFPNWVSWCSRTVHYWHRRGLVREARRARQWSRSIANQTMQQDEVRGSIELYYPRCWMSVWSFVADADAGKACEVRIDDLHRPSMCNWWPISIKP